MGAPRSLLLIVVIVAAFAACKAHRAPPSFDHPAEATGGGAGAIVAAVDTSTDPPPSPAPPPSPPPAAARDPLARLLKGQAQLDALCARGLGDPVAKAFCATPGHAPKVASLVELENLIGLAFVPGNLENGIGGNPAFTLIGNSSSLVARFTSAINPRALIFTPPNRRTRLGADGTALAQGAPCTDIEPISPLPTFVALGFTRGEELVELIAKDPDAEGGKGALDFFLFTFEHACTHAPGGCTPGDLLTPAGEAGFTGEYTLYQDEDIADTILDCKQCHQPAGPGSKKMLRMQELQNPWAHFFRNNRDEGRALRDDYIAAHGDETYAGIPGVVLTNLDEDETSKLKTQLTKSRGSDPGALQGLVENEGFCEQPNEYVTITIQAEVKASSPGQPFVNLPMGTSASWMSLFKVAQAGEAIPTPYHDVKVSDPDKLASMTQAYVNVRQGLSPAADLPDIRDVFLDAALSDLTFRPTPGASGRELLTTMCAQCHNRRLDQTISRARFRVDDLDLMPRAEKEAAIQRLRLPHASALRMPPVRFRELSDAEIDLVVAELRR